MSSSNTSSAIRAAVPMSSFLYRSTDQALEETIVAEAPEQQTEPEIRLTEKSLADRLAAERAAGFAEAEAKMRQDFEIGRAHV